MKGDEEESMEQMMIQSMANIQFEALRKMFIDYPLKIGDLLSKNPKELHINRAQNFLISSLSEFGCFDFKFTHLNSNSSNERTMICKLKC